MNGGADDGATATGSLVILGVTWTETGPALRLRVPGHRSELVEALGTELRYRVGDNPTRHCVGHVSVRKNGGEYVDCDNPPQPNERNCVRCAVADAEFAGSLHHAHTRNRSELDEAVVRHLDQTNVLYLAAFRDGSIKVGTSTEHRTEKRLTEQGAWRAVVVATANDGFVVRRLEDLVTSELGVPQSVAVKRKVSGLVSPMDDTRLTDRLEPLIDRVHGLIEADPDLRDDGVAEAKDLWENPTGGDAVWSGLHAYPARLDRGKHHFELAAMSGRVAVLTRPDTATATSTDRFAADLSPLFGIELDVGEHEPDQLMVQDSLF